MTAADMAALRALAEAVIGTQGHDPECHAYTRHMSGIHPAAVLSLLDDVERLRTMLSAAAIQFNYYADQHMAKGTEDSDKKMRVNAEFARACRAVLEPRA